MQFDGNQAGWSITHAPAANNVATITRPAGAGRHICTGIVATTVGGATVTPNVQVNLRDGASGAGTILASFAMGILATAGGMNVLPITDLAIAGSPNTPMTLEFAAGGGTNGVQSVTMTGITV